MGVRYARLGELKIAYQEPQGDLVDVVNIPNWLSHCEFWQHVDPIVRYWRRINRFARMTYFDMPGSGLSDPVPDDRPPTLEEYADCARAVMDDVGIERAWVMSFDVGCQAALMFAATHPDRTLGLILQLPLVRARWGPDYPNGLSDEALEATVEALGSLWGTESYVDLMSPSAGQDPEGRRQMAGWFRAARSPAAARELFAQVVHTDVRHLLPLIRVPTLVIHPLDAAVVPVGSGRYVAERIDGARLVEPPTGGGFPFTEAEQDRWVGEIQSFVTGVSGDLGHADRVLATVMFTDIVSSTERAAALGDELWRAILDRHDDLVGMHVRLHGGRVVKTTGDGALATFDGPARAIRCARGVADAVKPLGIEIRAGLHTGEVERRGDDIGGIAVHIAARVAASAEAGEVLVSHAVPPLVAGSGLDFETRGERDLKGVPGTWSLFAAV